MRNTLCNCYNVGHLSDNRCPLLPHPDDGNVTCSLTRDDAPADGESCSITCDSDFDLSGSSSRTCQIQSGRGSWTGTAATCRGMYSGTSSCIYISYCIARLYTVDSIYLQHNVQLTTSVLIIKVCSLSKCSDFPGQFTC